MPDGSWQKRLRVALSRVISTVTRRRSARNYVIIIRTRLLPVSLVSFNRTPLGMHIWCGRGFDRTPNLQGNHGNCYVHKEMLAYVIRNHSNLYRGLVRVITHGGPREAKPNGVRDLSLFIFQSPSLCHVRKTFNCKPWKSSSNVDWFLAAARRSAMFITFSFLYAYNSFSHVCEN